MQRGRRIAYVVLVALLLVPAASEAARFGGRVLKEGTRGGDVKKLQRLLTKAGFRTTVDGVFGPGTESVVMDWEDANDRAVNGRVSRADARALRSDAAQAADDDGDTPTEEPVPDDPIDPDADNVGETTSGGAGYVEITPGRVSRAGMARSPSNAPQEVQEVIEGGNEIHDMPYKYGGGHGRFPKDSGYDCSGSVSYALHAAGLLKAPRPSGGFESYGKPGPGQWITIYANGGHMYMVVAGLRFDTSGAKERGGSRWTDDMRPPAGYVVRHPPGL